MDQMEKRVDMDFNGIPLTSMDVTLKQLYYFVVVAETGSITQSAQRMYISQPTLSKSLAQLEKRIGEPLFAHEGRTVTLTKAGAFLYKRWKPMIRNFCNDLKDIDSMRAKSVSTFRLGTFPVLDSYSFLQPYTDRMRQLFPETEISMLRMNYIRLLEYLNGNLADLIFMLEFDMPQKDSAYEWQEVSRLPMVAVMAADHPLARQDIHSFSQLTGHRLIFSEPEGILTRQAQVERLMRTYNILPEHFSYANNDLTAYLAAEQGKGIAIGIRPLYPADNPRVIIRELEDMDYVVLAVWRKNTSAEIKSMIHELLA